MKRKGFTLIELLAVIIILAVIALIATPIVLDVVDNAKESSFASTVYGMIDAMRLNSMENRLEGSSMEKSYEFPSEELDMQGEQLTGIGNVSEDGKIRIAVHNEKLCAIKSYSDGKITVTDYVEGECTFPTEESNTVYKDKSGANAPDLLDNMIPVKYEDGSWVYASLYEEWYDYKAQKWANAIVLNSNAAEYAVGDPIDMDDIDLMYVWIPRYTYTIFNAPVLCNSVEGLSSTYNSAYSTCYTGTTVDTYVGTNYTYTGVEEQLINVKFETGTASSGTVSCSDVDFTTNPESKESEVCTDKNGRITKGVSTYTHPAFTFGEEELTGIWVGKFEIGVSSTSTSTSISTSISTSVSTSVSTSAEGNSLVIKPNVYSVADVSVSTFFDLIQNLGTTYSLNGDSHMMKNMEWGAVAYLKQSQYGLGIKDIGFNNYFYLSANGSSMTITGCGAEAGSAKSETCIEYNAGGEVASTTGNVYGVYDMSGGEAEYVMGNAVSLFGTLEGFEITSHAKYYDAYAYDKSSTITHARGKLGDATKETLLRFGSNTGGWTSDYANFPDSGAAWFGRGGNYYDGDDAGVFGFVSDNGIAHVDISARAVLVR